jgi:5-methylcytosine-specific restriction endonuclease McrA
MNYAKAQSDLRDKYTPTAPIWHKYSFGGEIRCYRNRLTIIDQAIVVYLGITKNYINHWSVPFNRVVETSKAFKKKKALNNDQFIRPESNFELIFTRKNKWVQLTDQILLTHPYRGKCCYCEIKLYLALNYSRDHIIPKSKGGKGDKNLRPCCCHCNGEKGDMHLKQYIELLNRKWKRSIKGSLEFKLLVIKINNANKIAKEIDPK